MRLLRKEQRGTYIYMPLIGFLKGRAEGEQRRERGEERGRRASEWGRKETWGGVRKKCKHENMDREEALIVCFISF